MTEMRWEEPPPKAQRGGRRSPLWPVFEELRRHPGRWAVVKTLSTPSVAQVATVNMKHAPYAQPPDQWEIVTRGAKVYARYIGNGKP